jgi:hypothetical protein
MVDPLNRLRNEDRVPPMSSRNFARRLERIEAELAPPEAPEMIEICFRALVDGEIISRYFMPRYPPKRGWRRHWEQNPGGYTSSWNSDRNDELTAPPGAQSAR